MCPHPSVILSILLAGVHDPDEPDGPCAVPRPRCAGKVRPASCFYALACTPVTCPAVLCCAHCAQHCVYDQALMRALCSCHILLTFAGTTTLPTALAPPRSSSCSSARASSSPSPTYTPGEVLNLASRSQESTRAVKGSACACACAHHWQTTATTHPQLDTLIADLPLPHAHAHTLCRWVWVFWLSPVTYVQQALCINEMKAPR